MWVLVLWVGVSWGFMGDIRREGRRERGVGKKEGSSVRIFIACVSARANLSASIITKRLTHALSGMRGRTPRTHARARAGACAHTHTFRVETLAVQFSYHLCCCACNAGNSLHQLGHEASDSCAHSAGTGMLRDLLCAPASDSQAATEPATLKICENAPCRL